MTASDGPITSQTPTSPHLSRLVWLAEQITEATDQVAELYAHDGIVADLTDQEHTLLRQAAATARDAGGDIVLIASAAHHRAARAGSGHG